MQTHQNKETTNQHQRDWIEQKREWKRVLQNDENDEWNHKYQVDQDAALLRENEQEKTNNKNLEIEQE